MSPKTAIRSFEQIQPGDRVALRRVLTRQDVEAFALLSGDQNPLHLDDAFARAAGFERPVVHGMLLAGLVSTLVGTYLPGPGALWAEQRFRWIRPLFLGDEVRVELEVKHKSRGARTLQLAVQAFNQDGELVLEGSGLATSLATTAPDPHGNS